MLRVAIKTVKDFHQSLLKMREPSEAVTEQAISNSQDSISVSTPNLLPNEILDLICNELAIEHIIGLRNLGAVHQKERLNTARNTYLRQIMKHAIDKKRRELRKAICENDFLNNVDTDSQYKILLPISIPKTLKSLRLISKDAFYSDEVRMACMQKLIAAKNPMLEDIDQVRKTLLHHLSWYKGGYYRGQRKSIISLVRTLVEHSGTEEDFDIARKWHSELEQELPRYIQLSPSVLVPQCEDSMKLACAIFSKAEWQQQDYERLIRIRDGIFFRKNGERCNGNEYSSSTKASLAIWLMQISADPIHLDAVRNLRKGSVLLRSGAAQTVSDSDRMRLAVAAVKYGGEEQDIRILRAMRDSSLIPIENRILGATKLVQHVGDIEDIEQLQAILNSNNTVHYRQKINSFSDLLSDKNKSRDFYDSIKSIAVSILSNPENNDKFRVDLASALLGLLLNDKNIYNSICTIRKSLSLNIYHKARLTNALLGIKDNPDILEDIDQARILSENAKLDVHLRSALIDKC